MFSFRLKKYSNIKLGKVCSATSDLIGNKSLQILYGFAFKQLWNGGHAALCPPCGPTAKFRKVPAKLRRVSKYIFAELCDLLCGTLRFKKSETADTRHSEL